MQRVLKVDAKINWGIECIIDLLEEGIYSNCDKPLSEPCFYCPRIHIKT